MSSIHLNSNTLRSCVYRITAITILCLVASPSLAQDSDDQVLARLDELNAKADRLVDGENQSWIDYLISHDWVDPATFYSVLAISIYGLYRFRRTQTERRYEYVTYVLNVPLHCHDDRKMPARMGNPDETATHGLVTGILREDQLETALDKKQQAQLDAAIKNANASGFLPLDHDMFAMFRTEICEIFNHYFMAWERKANTYECAVFREMYFSVLYETFTERKHLRIVIIPKDRLQDLPQNDNEDKTTILRSKKMISRLPNLRFMRDEMHRVETGEIASSAYVRTFEIMDQRPGQTRKLPTS